MVGILWLAIALSESFSSDPQPAPATRPVVVVEIEPPPYFVGQGIKVSVTAPTGDLQAPVIAGSDLIALGSPSMATSVARSEFVLIPHRTGALTIGSFRVKVNDRIVGSKPATIQVAGIPLPGRSPAFLGGVGHLELASQVEPNHVRVGELVEFRITMVGQAAWGSTPGPQPGSLPAGLQLRSTARSLDPTDPPVRTIRYRLRAIEPGRLVLPPVAVAAFDPTSRRFQTYSTASQVVTVASPPAFDSSAVRFGSTPPAALQYGRWAWVGAGLVALLLGLSWRRLSLWGWWAQRGARRPVQWQHEARHLARWCRVEGRGVESVVPEILDRFARIIERSIGWRLAVLTPNEASAAVALIVRDDAVCERVRRLVATCDRIRFDLNADATVGDLEELVAEAVAVLQAIGESAPIHRPDLIQSKRFSSRNPGPL